MIVVPVLTTSCHVSDQPNNGPESAPSNDNDHSADKRPRCADQKGGALCDILKEPVHFPPFASE